MRNSSAANSAASSPPVPARTSRIALRSSSSSARQERHFDGKFQLGQPFAQALHLFFSERLHLGVAVRPSHLLGGRELALSAAQRLDAIDDRRQLAVLLRQLGEIGAAQPRRQTGRRAARRGGAPAGRGAIRARLPCRPSSAAPALALPACGGGRGGGASALRRPASSARRAPGSARRCRDRAASPRPGPARPRRISTAARAPTRSARRMRRARLPE